MQHRRIPNTDLDVSALCLGTGGFGTHVTGADADRLAGEFLNAGGNFFDTAHCYAFWLPDGLGASERELGACLHRLGALGDAVISTKGGHPDGGPSYPRPDRYLSPELLERDITESLERLGVARIDLYSLHRDDARVPVGEIVDALDAEVKRGRVRYLGASNWSVGRIAAANAYADRHGRRGFVASQVQWSLAEPEWPAGPDPVMRHVTAEDAAWYAAAGIPVMAYTATAGGYFAREPAGGAFDSPDNRARRARAHEMAGRLGCTPTQVALAYLLHRPAPVIPLFSTSNPAHLAEAVAALDVELSEADVAWLRGQ